MTFPHIKRGSSQIPDSRTLNTKATNVITCTLLILEPIVQYMYNSLNFNFTYLLRLLFCLSNKIIFFTIIVLLRGDREHSKIITKAIQYTCNISAFESDLGILILFLRKKGCRFAIIV